MNTSIRKYSSRAFVWVVTPLGFVGQFRISKFSAFGSEKVKGGYLRWQGLLFISAFNDSWSTKQYDIHSRKHWSPRMYKSQNNRPITRALIGWKQWFLSENKMHGNFFFQWLFDKSNKTHLQCLYSLLWTLGCWENIDKTDVGVKRVYILRLHAELSFI